MFTHLPLTLLHDFTTAFLNEVIVSKDEVIHQRNSEGTRSSGGGNEIFQTIIFGDGWETILIIQR